MDRARRMRAASQAVLEGLEDRQLFSVFTVNSAADSGAGTLRQAITDANNTQGPDEILFELGGASTITPATPLPTVTDALSIDGRTEAEYGGTPLITISGELLGSGADGLTLDAPSSRVAGLVINGFGGGAGVRVMSGADHAEVLANYIGTDASGQLDSTPNAQGVVIDGSDATVSGNVVSGNLLQNVWITAGGANAKVTGNLVGTNATGDAAVTEIELGSAFGIEVDGAAGVQIGGAADADRNVISGNARSAVALNGASSATVVGNYIGVDVTGQYAIGDGSGVSVQNSSDSVTVRGNVISAVQGTGVQVDSSSHVTIAGNTIGAVVTDALGNTFDEFGLGYDVQGDGVSITGPSSFVTVGGTGAGDMNVLAGGEGDGVFVATDNTSQGIVIQGNLIGTMADGVTAMGWWGNGVFTQADGAIVRGNVIGAAQGSGVVVQGSNTLVDGNLIGVGADRVTAIANPFGDGLYIAASNVIVSNNAIANNFGNGVTVASGTGNKITGNSIYNNGLVGIDLGIDGVTANDSQGHTGPNDYQNFPVLGTILRTPTGVRVSGTLNAAANGTFMVELFSNTAASGSGYGEGQTYLGSVAVVTDVNGLGTFDVRLTDVPVGQTFISATATDASGNTSEFAADGTVPDTITTFATQTTLASSAGVVLAGAPVTFTATVSSAAGVPDGDVTFFDGNTAIGTGTLVNGVATLTTGALAVGDHTITAVYAAQGDYDGSSSTPLAQGVDATTTTTLVTSTTAATLGDAVTLTATVMASAGSLSGGTVSFFDGGTLLGTGTVDASGVASLVTTSLGGGAHSLVASFATQGHFRASNSAAVGVSVSVPTSTTLSESAATSVYGGGGVTLTATVAASGGSGVAAGAVTFLDGDTVLGTATVDANGVATFVATSLGAGAHSLTASYGGAGFDLPSGSAAVSHHVFVATTTTVTTASDTVTEGQPVVFTASVAAAVGTPGGVVTFFDGSTPLGTVALDASGMAMLSVSTLPVGPHSITASYAASGDYLASNSGAVPLTVNARQVTNIGTTTTLSSSQNPSTLGQAVTFTATVAADTGTAAGSVTFKDGNTVLGTAALDANGVATFTTSLLSGGAHTITAVYAGQDNYLGSSSAPLAQGVNVVTATSLSESAAASNYGQVVTFTASVNAPAGGLVTFLDGDGTVLGTANLAANGTAAITLTTLGPGAHTVAAAYAGAGYYLPSASAAVSHAVSVVTTTSLSASVAAAQYGSAVTFTATVSAPVGVAGGSVSFFDGSTLLGTGTLSGGVASLTTGSLALGGHSVIAVYAGAGSDLGSTSNAVSVAVSTATTTALSASASSAVFGQAVTFTATVSGSGGVPTGSVTFYDGNTAIGTGALGAGGVATLVSSTLGRGSHAIKAVYSGQGAFGASTSAPANVVVNVPTTTVLTVSDSGSGSGGGSGGGSGCGGGGYGGGFSFWCQPSRGGYGGGGSGCGGGGSGSQQSQSVTLTATVTSPSGIPGGTVTFYDGTTAIGTGLLSAGGVATLTISSLGSGQHTLVAVYGGGQNYLGSTSAPVTYGVKSTTSTISGTVWLDLSGNGLSDDDQVLGGVTVKLFQDRNGNGRIDSADGAAIASDVSDNNGAYSFGSLPAGKYLVQELTPSNYVRTAPALSDTYVVNASAGNDYTNLDFDNYHTCSCSKNVTGVIYIVNGKSYTDLRGHVKEGDTVTVQFTVRPGASVTLSLVSYTAPGATFDAKDADEQQIYDLTTGTYTQGTYKITVQVPKSYFQVDFVCGEAIDQFGPAGSNVFYSAQDRLYSADNGGVNSADGIVPLV